MRATSRSSRFVVGLMAIGLVAAACGKSSSHTATPASSTAASTTASTAPAAAVADLAPTGTLRLAVVGPPFLAHGTPSAGIAVELATALAARLGVPLTTAVYPNPPALLAATHTPGWDVAVMPMLPATTAAVDFSGPILLVPHTLLVGPGRSIHTLADADRAGVRIASEAHAPHTPVLASQLPRATIVPVPAEADGLAMLKAGQVDAFADARLRMAADSAQVAGSTVLAENFFTFRVAGAITHGHPAGLAYLSAFVEQLKASGAVKQAIDRAQLTDVPVAPPASSTPSPTTTAP
jgi:polar amino acid transport system substrate-binding protein